MFLILNTSLGTALGQASDEAWIWVRRPYGACRDGHPVASRLWEGICCVMAQAADGTPILVNESKPSTYIYPEGTSTHLRVRRWYPSIHLRFLLAICLFAITYQYAVLATTGKRLLSGIPGPVVRRTPYGSWLCLRHSPVHSFRRMTLFHSWPTQMVLASPAV